MSNQLTVIDGYAEERRLTITMPKISTFLIYVAM